MAYSVDILYTKNEDFSNPLTETEAGKPASVELTGLDSSETYYAKAVLKNDGTMEDESEITSFQTIAAGVITLEHISTTRSGYGYDVTYRYTSTYAPSSAILSTNGTQFQGFIDSAQHAVSFWVTGLTAGTAYLTNVTMYDIYAESVTVTGSIVTTVVNEVRITDTTPAQTSVECELDYVIDSGFTVGYVEYWLGTQDPSTEQAQGHFYFNNGDTSVTAGGLTAGTAYLFRATILLGDGTTEIYSSVVSASTTTDYNTKYLRIDNRGTTQSTLYIKNYTPSPTYDCPNWNNCYTKPDPLYYGGTSWYSKQLNAADITITNISAGYGTNFKHNGRMSGSYYSSRETLIPFSFYTSGSNEFSVSGNLNSLINGDDFQTTFTTYTGQWAQLFYGWTSLTDISKLKVGVTTIPVNGMSSMFYGCTKLKKGLDLRNVTRCESGSFDKMYDGCTSLTEVYAPNISEWDTGMFYKWLNNVAPTGVIHKPRNLTIPTDTTSGVPTGWTTQDY